jgi:hypothetical protein
LEATACYVVKTREACDAVAPASLVLRCTAPRRCSPPWNCGAVPHRWGGGARRRHRILTLTTRGNDAALKLLPGAPATSNRSSDFALWRRLSHDLLGVLPRR